MSGSDQAKDKAEQKIGEAKETGHDLRDKAAGAVHDFKERQEDE